MNKISNLREKDKYSEKIYHEELDINFVNRENKQFRDELNSYTNTLELIRSGNKIATTINLTNSDTYKWKNLKTGTIIKLKN